MEGARLKEVGRGDGAVGAASTARLEHPGERNAAPRGFSRFPHGDVNEPGASGDALLKLREDVVRLLSPREIKIDPQTGDTNNKHLSVLLMKNNRETYSKAQPVT